MTSMIRKKINQVVISSAITVFSSMSFMAQADSSVWKVSKDNEVVYVGGTVHILPESEFPLPEEFEATYKKADKLVFEVINLDPNDPALQQKLMKSMMYSDGSTLKSKVSSQTWKKFEDYCRQYGLQAEQFNQFKPSMVMLTFSAIEWKKHGLVGEGVDKYFENKADKDGIEKLGLETLESQISMLSNIGTGHEDAFLNKSLDDLNNTQVTLAKMIKAWRAGDESTLESVGIKPLIESSEGLYEQLLVKRNKHWIEQIEPMFATKPVEFILVGALHLVGDDSVLKMLSDKGYKVEKVNNSPL